MRVPIAEQGAEDQCELDGSKEEPAFWTAAEKARLHFCARTIRDAGVKVNVTNFQLRDDGVGAVRSEQAASEGELALKMAALNRMAKPAIAALERATRFVWESDATCFIFESGAFFTAEVRDLWRLAGAFSESLDDILRIRWIISALELVRLNLRLFPLAGGATNVARHAAARRVEVKLESAGGEIRLPFKTTTAASPPLRSRPRSPAGCAARPARYDRDARSRPQRRGRCHDALRPRARVF